MQTFIDQIIKNLETNGFPIKRVSLPTEKMFEIADNKGLSFNAVLDEMKVSHQILGAIEDEKIVFSKCCFCSSVKLVVFISIISLVPSIWTK